MSKELSTTEESMKEILIDLMTERVIFVGIQASLMRGVQVSSSTAHGSRPSQVVTEKTTKHRDDLENMKLLLSILPEYIPPLAGVVSCDSVPKDFDYTIITAYLPKGIRTFIPHLERIPTLNISDYNLGYRKIYGILSPHKYLTKMKGKKKNIIPHPWTMNFTQSTLFNVMNIPHFGRHREVNTCVKLLFSCFHGGYLWLDKHITIDMALIHRITRLSMQGRDPQDFYLGKVVGHTLAQTIKQTYDDVEKGT
jgi:hypothetical protein